MAMNEVDGLRPPAALVPIHAVIFDCDGTLVDSEVTGMDVLYEPACVHGLDATREQAHHRFRGMRMTCSAACRYRSASPPTAPAKRWN
jgi:beta-phosphoglucomutase-like phosphatase (HAD superfamily)